MLIGMLLFWVLVILAAIGLSRALSGNHSYSPTRGNLTPRQILDRRLARGQISRIEYDQIMTDLSN